MNTTTEIQRHDSMTPQIHRVDAKLAELCESQFAQIGWSKPAGYFRACLAQQRAGQIVMFVAHSADAYVADSYDADQGGAQYVGHVKLVWQPDYPGFAAQGIPEISDLNVLPSYRKRGVGTGLIRACEALAAERCRAIGIGVGLHPGYNNAQRLYSKLGYVLDGRGVHYENVSVTMGASYRFDDELIIYFTKQLASSEHADI